MKNEINGLKFTDEVRNFDNEVKLNQYMNSFIQDVHNSLDMLENKEINPKERVLQQENIIDQIYCCYIEAMRWELIYGTPSTTCRDKLIDLQNRLLALSNETGNEFLKLQTGFVSILINYINTNS